MDAEKKYLESLPAIERIAGFVARRGHINADESGEFVQVVRVKLFDDDYAVIRKFEERSSFTTYLTTVIIRLFHQWRVEQWGKWRPSAEAKRLGEPAITLERLMTRDGYTFPEAVNILTTRKDAPCTKAQLEALYVRLPLRNPRPMLVSDEGSADVAVEPEAVDRVQRGDRKHAAHVAMKAIDDAIHHMDAEDQVVLQMRFWKGLKVPEIARTLHLDQKKLYKRLDRLFADLRGALKAAGLSKDDIASLLGRADEEIHLDIFPPEPPPSSEPPTSSAPPTPPTPPTPPAPPPSKSSIRPAPPPGIRNIGPSHPVGEGPVRGGEGRLP